MTDQARALADALMAADRAEPIGTLPSWLPQTAADAIAVQRLVVGERPVMAWKVARNGTLGPVAAPMLRTVIATGATAQYDLAYSSAVETEIAFKLSRDLAPLPAGEQRSLADLLDHVGSIHLGVELLEHRLTPELRMGYFALALADAMNNGGYVLGPQLPRARVLALMNDPVGAGHDLTLSLDGRPVASGAVQHVDGNPLMPLLDLVNNAVARQQRGEADSFWQLRAGDIVTTGCFGPAVPLHGAQRIDIDWLASFSIEHAAAAG